MGARRAPPRGPDVRPHHLLVAVAVIITVAACGDAPRPVAPADPPQPPQAGASPTVPAVDARRLAEVRSFRSVRRPVTVAAPARIAIPAIGVDSDLQRLGRDRDGAIEVPTAWQVAGWYAPGVKPGQPGPAVIIGHVDSRDGPAVFFRLRELTAGDEIVITRADGSRSTFLVDRIERHAKTRFPTDDVYLPTLRPTLRVVTCDGAFDRATGHYRDNLVVFADLR